MDPHYVLYYYYGVVGYYMYYLVLGRTNGPSLCATILLLWRDGVHLSPRLLTSHAVLHSGMYTCTFIGEIFHAR